MAYLVFSAAPALANNVEMDLFGTLSESFSSNALALVASASATTTPQDNVNLDSTAPFAPPSSASNNFSPLFEDPFGDSPFKATPSAEIAPSQPQMHRSLEPSLSSGPNTKTVSNFGFGDSFSVVSLPYSTSGASDTQPLSSNSQVLPQDLSTPQEVDILADILPSAPSPGTTLQQNFSAPPNAQPSASFSASSGQMASQSFLAQTGQLTQQGLLAATSQPAAQAFSVHTGQLTQQVFSAPRGQLVQPPFSVPSSQHAQQPFPAHADQPSRSGGHTYSRFQSQAGSLTPGASSMFPQSQSGHNRPMYSGNFLPQGFTASIPLYMAPQAPTGQLSESATAHLASQSPMDQASQFNSGNFISQQQNAALFTHQAPGGKQSDIVGSLPGQGVNAPAASQSRDKFETKSTVWADTLSRGLVNLNISGPKINPLADIGIDFDAINRKEKRMEKPNTAPATSTVTMGKAMGSGSGIGRVGAGALRPSSNPMMGMGNGPGFGMGVGGYGGINVAGMGTGQGVQMQPPTGLPPGSNVPGGNYNFMMGSGGYPQQPYGGGYR